MSYSFLEARVNWLKWNSSFCSAWLLQPYSSQSFLTSLLQITKGNSLPGNDGQASWRWGSFTLGKSVLWVLISLHSSPSPPSPGDSLSALSARSVSWKADFCTSHDRASLLAGFCLGLANGGRRQEKLDIDTSCPNLYCSGKALILAASMTTASISKVSSWPP